MKISGLLHPSLLSGEGGYYLTTLSSAVHVLKNFKDSCEENARKKPEVCAFKNAENCFDFFVRFFVVRFEGGCT